MQSMRGPRHFFSYYLAQILFQLRNKKMRTSQFCRAVKIKYSEHRLEKNPNFFSKFFTVFHYILIGQQGN